MLRCDGFSLLLLTLAAGCSCGDSTPGRDAGRDAGRDSGTDAGRRFDAGPRDAGRDARPTERDAGPPQWMRLAGLPEACVVEMAHRPEAMGPIRIEPCTAPSRCRRLAPDWVAETVPKMTVVGAGTDVLHGYVGFLRTTGSEDSSSRMDAVLVARDDGVVVGAWIRRTPDVVCNIFPLAIGQGRIAFAVTSETDEWIFGGDIADVPATVRLIVHFARSEVSGNFVQRMVVARDVVGIETAPDNRVLFGRWDGTWSTVGSAMLDGQLAYVASAWNDALFFHSYGSSASVPYRARVSVGGAPNVVLVERDGAEAGPIFAHGGDMAWAHLYERVDGYFSRVEIWTSPFATDPAAVVPRRLADSPDRLSHAYGRAGPGHVAFLEVTPPGGIAVYDLTDGRRALIQPLPDSTTIDASYLTADEIAVSDGRTTRTGIESTVRIFRFDALVWE